MMDVESGSMVNVRHCRSSKDVAGGLVSAALLHLALRAGCFELSMRLSIGLLHLLDIFGASVNRLKCTVGCGHVLFPIAMSQGNREGLSFSERHLHAKEKRPAVGVARIDLRFIGQMLPSPVVAIARS